MRAGHHEPAHAGGADFLVVADRGRCRPVACSCPSEPRGVRRARAARTGPGAAAQPRAAHAPVKREPAWHMLPPPARAGASVHRGSGPGDRICRTKSGRRGRMVPRHQGSRPHGSAGGLGRRHGRIARVMAIEESAISAAIRGNGRKLTPDTWFSVLQRGSYVQNLEQNLRGVGTNKN